MEPIIQADYEKLATIQKRLERQAQMIGQTIQRLQTQLDRLEGSWQGKGSAAFFMEMQNKTMPATQRLKAALHHGSQFISTIILIYEEAEREAAPLFQSSQLLEIKVNATSQNVDLSRVVSQLSGEQKKGDVPLLDEISNRMDMLNRVTVLPLLAQDFAKGKIWDAINKTRRIMLENAIPHNWWQLPSVADDAVEAVVRATPGPIGVIEKLSRFKPLELLDKALSPVDFGVNVWKFVKEPTVETGAGLGASGLGLWAAFGSDPGALLAGAFAGGYTIGETLVPDSFKGWVGDKLTDWDPLNLGYSPGKYPRTTIKEYARKGREMPLESARGVFMGLLDQHGRDAADKFATEYSKRNNVELNEVVPWPLR
jgi:WXG100 family type VII secretion target